jgi:quercetin 2,3-dioxygenase
VLRAIGTWSRPERHPFHPSAARGTTGETAGMSGPVSRDDVDPVGPDATSADPVFDLTESRDTVVGRARVRRALPRRARRTVGPWCFVDHFGPMATEDGGGIDIGPHPHIGLQTVTWLLTGEVLHRDSLGSEQPIRPGQLNLMTAGRGVAHAEEGTGYRGEVHGVQLWVAKPDETRNGPADFEHHAELPRLELDGGAGDATVLVGEVGGVESPARHDTGQVGVDVGLRGSTTIPLRPEFEHAVVLFDGAAEIDGHPVTPGALAYLGCGRDHLDLSGEARALLLGGLPFPDELVMWWNFVGRSREEVGDAYADWEERDERFGPVDSTLDRIDAPVPPWL